MKLNVHLCHCYSFGTIARHLLDFFKLQFTQIQYFKLFDKLAKCIHFIFIKWSWSNSHLRRYMFRISFIMIWAMPFCSFEKTSKNILKGTYAWLHLTNQKTNLWSKGMRLPPSCPLLANEVTENKWNSN